MSQRPSSCIPPPSDYAPQSRNTTSRYRDRSKRGGQHDRSARDHQSSSVKFHSDKLKTDCDDDGRLKQQPKDRFHRNDDDDYFARVQNEDVEECDCERFKLDESVEANEDDPLDAYMKSLESGSDPNVKTSTKCDGYGERKNESHSRASSSGQETERARGVRLDIDETDDVEESYYKCLEDEKNKSDNQEEDERQDLIEYDNDGNVISIRKVKREVEPLPTIDHSKISYNSFEKSFYQEHEEISKLTPEQSDVLRAKLEIKVSGNAPPKPVCSFAHFKFDERLMKVIRKSEYYQPTPIQAQAIPAALAGRNMIGIAMTGSGKTAAYLWPMIIHIMNQPDLKTGDGPIGLVLVPTRELALQVYGEARKFSNSYKLSVVCAYGGGSKYEQTKDLEAGAEIVVATPGRIIDLIKTGATNLRRTTYLVLDEADRFFEMGFETQVRSICDHIRPDRQTLLFSATFKHRVEQLARTVTDNPIKIVQKSLGEANEDVTQHVVIFQDVAKKWNWLTDKFVEFTSAGSVLIFVTRILNSEELHKNLADMGLETLLLHGDMEQSERNRVITAFKRKECGVMIATDVAARGLDIAHIKTVINYDVARDIDTHTHRIGRTGRAGSRGDAYTLLSSERDREFAGHLVKNLESSKQKVSDELMQLAMRSYTFRKSRERRDHHRKPHDHLHHNRPPSSSGYHQNQHRIDNRSHHNAHDHSNQRLEDKGQNHDRDHRKTSYSNRSPKRYANPRDRHEYNKRSKRD